MWPDRLSNPGPLTYESDALSTALRGPALVKIWNRLVGWLLVKGRSVYTESLPRERKKKGKMIDKQPHSHLLQAQ